MRKKSETRFLSCHLDQDLYLNVIYARFEKRIDIFICIN